MGKRPLRSYTTGDVARLCAVTKRTVIKWIDSGRLRGYRIPGSKHRRIAGAELAKFMREHGLPEYREIEPRRKVLIVDDDPDLGELLRDALRESYDVEVAVSALEAATRAPVFAPDLLLVDVRLPDVNGLELCRRLRSLLPALKAPILAMSAYGSEIDPAEIRRSGAAGFLPKPLRMADLKNRIRAMVG